jgi:hypothetical protein
VSDDSSFLNSPDFSPAWKDLASNGYVLIQDWTLGVSDDSREQFHQRYFNEDVLRHDEGDEPQDRERARDVIHYTWSGPDLELEEYGTITITDRAGIKGERTHNRVEVLRDPLAEELVRMLLCLVPPGRRKRKGTFGINFFRTYTDVVSRPHRDNEEYIFLYVMHRDGDGARSYLYRADEPSQDAWETAPRPQPKREETEQELGPLVLDHQLNPGELLVFEDKLFKHGATPLEAPPDGKAMRDVVVCTVDYPETYLERTFAR